MSAVVRNPGARGGKFWVDANGHIRYGTRPTGQRRPAPAEPDTSPPPPADGLGEQAHHQEFGPWSKDATAVYLKQALRYAPCLVNIIQRYLDMVSRYGVGAAAEAFKLLTPGDVPAATAALGRVRRLARWDRSGRVEAEGVGTPLPNGIDQNPAATLRDPFVQEAMKAGMPRDAALLWQQLALRCLNRDRTAGDLSDVLLSKSERQLVWLAKAVMNPGSRGGHVYWKDGRLHYGFPTGPAHRRRRASGLLAKNPPQGPSPLARALMRQGRRIEYRDHAGRRTWGNIVTATGDILAVLSDDARPYDLLHTVCVPVQAVLKVTQEAPEVGQIVEKSSGAATTLGRHPGDPESRHRPAEDDSCWPEEE